MDSELGPCDEENLDDIPEKARVVGKEDKANDGKIAQYLDEKTVQTKEDTFHQMTVCSGCDQQYRVAFECEHCHENFCKECLINEHPQNKHICLNCDQLTDDEDTDDTMMY